MLYAHLQMRWKTGTVDYFYGFFKKKLEADNSLLRQEFARPKGNLVLILLICLCYSCINQMDYTYQWLLEYTQSLKSVTMYWSRNQYLLIFLFGFGFLFLWLTFVCLRQKLLISKFSKFQVDKFNRCWVSWLGTGTVWQAFLADLSIMIISDSHSASGQPKQ